MRFKLLPFTAIGLASLLSACSLIQSQEAHVIPEDTVLPLEEIDRLVSEFRTKAVDEPSATNLANFKQILIIRTNNMDRIQAEKERLARAPYGEKHLQVSRDNTLDWDNMGRGGAAMRQPAYVHTLSGFNNVNAPAEVATSFGQLGGKNNAAIHKAALDKALKSSNDFGTPNKEISYSVYELSRWERFCENGGVKMDRRDRAFVQKEGVNNLPEHLRSTCNPPKILP